MGDDSGVNSRAELFISECIFDVNFKSCKLPHIICESVKHEDCKGLVNVVDCAAI